MLTRSLCLSLALMAACADDPVHHDDATISDTTPDTSDVAETTETGDTADASAPETTPQAVVAPLDAAAPERLPATLTSCATIDATRCVDGHVETCALYDTSAESFATEPDALTLDAYRYDRWYDLYHRPDGVTAERYFTEPMPPGTPESVWGDPAKFAGWAGVGDGAIWTGSALNAAVFRYAATGSEADYQRLVERTRDLLRLFEVTGIPGYLARNPYILMPAGGPDSDQHIVRFSADGPHEHPIDPAALPSMPAAYRDGLPDAGGILRVGTPMWHGNPSIDQYTGPMVALPLAWSLLRESESALKSEIATQLTCYLKRLQRIELVNLQQNPTALEAVRGFLAGGNLVLDPDDPDLGSIDTVVAYALRQPNAANVDTFDRSCPDSVALTATRTLDASADDFIVQLLELAGDMQPPSNPNAPSPRAIDHVYAINVRGGDASHILHLAAMAYLLTGDGQYQRFLDDELVGRLHVDQTTHMLGAFTAPRWCRSYYGDHITFGPHWALLTILADSPLRRDLLAQNDSELRQRLMADTGNAKFALMYGALMPAGSPGRDALLEEGLAALAGFDDEPRREHSMSRADVIADLPEGTTVVCPTEAERARCETGYSVLGATIPGEDITHACDGSTAECVMADGECADPMASHGLPPELRRYADFMWQRNPFALGETFGEDYRLQSPGLDLVEEYWLARAYGLTERGASLRLAWKSGGTCD